MATDSQAAFAVSIRAVERLASEKGLDARFPFDAIWEYAEEEVSSTLRPGQSGRLIKGGYIEKTGGITNATSPSRAGSPTAEYRLGRLFRSPEAPSPLDDLTSVAETLNNIQKAMAGEGFIVTIQQLANFYLALKTSPLVILAGTSGTGKSKLPRLFAKFIDAYIAPISVQPQWSDNADLFGYTRSLSPDIFVEGKFTHAAIWASSNSKKPAIILLDEMNLAAVEHYFSDFLSVVETRRKSGGTIITDPLPLDLPSPKEPDPYQRHRGLYLASNIRVVGTANMDETTHMFSPKVLDRAFSIEFWDVDLTTFIEAYSEKEEASKSFAELGVSLIDTRNPISVHEVYDSSRALFDNVAGLAEEIKEILKPSGISFGFRTRDAICLYMWHWDHDKLADILPLHDALDLCILQKILPKISGTGEGLRQSLEELHKWLLHAGTTKEIAKALPDEEAKVDTEEHSEEETLGDLGVISSSSYQLSAEKVKRMLQKLDDEGAVTYWGV